MRKPRKSKARAKSNRYKRYGSYAANDNHRRSAAAARLLSGATNSSGQWTVAGNDDREPGGHHTREGIGWKQESPTVAAPPHRLRCSDRRYSDTIPLFG